MIEQEFEVSLFIRIKDKLSNILYYPPIADSAGADTDETKEDWLRRHKFQVSNDRSVIKRIGHFFVCHRIYAISNKAVELIDWRTTVLVYVIIAALVLLALFLLELSPWSTGWYGTHRTP